jgi:hypothetical protein
MERPLFAMLQDELQKCIGGALLGAEPSKRAQGLASTTTVKSLNSIKRDPVEHETDDATDGHDYEYQEEVALAFKDLGTGTDTDDHDYEYQEEVRALYDGPAKPARPQTKFLDQDDDDDHNPVSKHTHRM